MKLFLQYLCGLIGHAWVKNQCYFCAKSEAEYGWLHWICKRCGEVERRAPKEAA